MKWFFLISAIVLEVFGTISMKLSDGFSKPWWAVAMVVGYVGCFGFLTMALKHFEMSIVYAVWSGLGIVILTILGFFFFDESFDIWKILWIILILVGVIGLNLATKAHA